MLSVNCIVLILWEWKKTLSRVHSISLMRVAALERQRRHQRAAFVQAVVAPSCQIPLDKHQEWT